MLWRLAILALLVVLVERSGWWRQRGAEKAGRAAAAAWLPAGRGGGENELRRETEHLLARTPRETPQPPAGLPVPAAGGPGEAGPAGSAPATHPAQVWVAPGLLLRQEPRAEAAVLGTVATIAKLPYLERRGDDFRVRYQEVEGWIHLPGYDRGDINAPPLGNAPEPPRPLPPLDPDPALLARARELLGARERRARLGPYELYTDSDDPRLEALLGQLAAAVEPAYLERYGGKAEGEAKGAVVLFSAEDSYRVFQLRHVSPAASGSAGVHHLGLIALYADVLPAETVGATLVHELTHLMNRRVVGPALPPWLDEGLCEDLSSSQIGPGGSLLTGEIGGRRLQLGPVADFSGPLTTFHRLREKLRARRLPGFRDISGAEWPGFAQAEGRRLSYDLAGAFVRYLVDGENGRRAPRLRAFLAEVARGGKPDAETLFAALGENGGAVEAGFETWLAATAGRLLDRH